jgi:hypothetical protein
MSLTSGIRLGHCEILVPLGAGGMGEVYRARKTHALIGPLRSKYLVIADGQRFLVLSTSDDSVGQPITVVLN